MTKAQRIQHKIGNQVRKQLILRSASSWRWRVIQDGQFTSATHSLFRKAFARPNV